MCYLGSSKTKVFNNGSLLGQKLLRPKHSFTKSLQHTHVETQKEQKQAQSSLALIISPHAELTKP